MSDIKFIYNRIGAYVIDIFIITSIVTLLGKVEFINPNKEQAKEASDYYYELNKESVSSVNDINKYLKDNVISKEELEELKKYELLKPVLDNYEEEINKEDSEKLVTEIYDYFKNGARETERLNLYQSIIRIVLVFLYFIVLPVFTGGVTIGKSIFGLRIVKQDESDAKFVNYLIRGLIIYGIVFQVISMILAYTLSVKDFYLCDMIVSYISIALILVTFGFMVFRKDCRSLHDLASDTKVINTKVEEEPKEEVEEIKEAKVEPVKKKKKTTKKKK